MALLDPNELAMDVIDQARTIRIMRGELEILVATNRRLVAENDRLRAQVNSEPNSAVQSEALDAGAAEGIEHGSGGFARAVSGRE